eukprot:8326764-Ditylum_brightwellii.AAC.1
MKTDEPSTNDAFVQPIAHYNRSNHHQHHNRNNRHSQKEGVAQNSNNKLNATRFTRIINRTKAI